MLSCFVRPGSWCITPGRCRSLVQLPDAARWRSGAGRSRPRPARGLGRVAVAAGGQLIVRVTKSPEPSHPRLSPARMSRCAHAIWRSCAVPATRSARRSSRRSTPKAVGNGGEPHPCATHGSGMPGGCAGTARPGCRPPHSPVWSSQRAAPDHSSTISPSGPFLFDIHGKRGYIWQRSQPAPHICIVASQLRRVRVTYNKLTLKRLWPPHFFEQRNN